MIDMETVSYAAPLLTAGAAVYALANRRFYHSMLSALIASPDPQSAAQQIHESYQDRPLEAILKIGEVMAANRVLNRD